MVLEVSPRDSLSPGYPPNPRLSPSFFEEHAEQIVADRYPPGRGVIGRETGMETLFACCAGMDVHQKEIGDRPRQNIKLTCRGLSPFFKCNLECDV